MTIDLSLRKYLRILREVYGQSFEKNIWIQYNFCNKKAEKIHNEEIQSLYTSSKNIILMTWRKMK
jgi:predicted CoA-binding protein